MPFIPVEDWRVKKVRKLLETATFLTMVAENAREAAQTAETPKERRRLMRIYRKRGRSSRRYIRKAVKLHQMPYKRGMR